MPNTQPSSRPASALARTVVNLLLVAVTLAGIAYIVPSLMGYERYVITGGSMSGTIEKGAIVFERPVPVMELAVGDVITYMPPTDSGVTNLVTHRLTGISRAEDGRTVFRTKGDANADPDPWRFSLTAQTQPVVSFSVPYAGYAVIALADRQTRMLVIGVPAGVVALLSIVELGKAVRPRRNAGSAPQPTSV